MKKYNNFKKYNIHANMIIPDEYMNIIKPMITTIYTFNDLIKIIEPISINDREKYINNIIKYSLVYSLNLNNDTEKLSLKENIHGLENFKDYLYYNRGEF